MNAHDSKNLAADLEGKVAIVTGAASGIGLATSNSSWNAAPR
jgi:NADP-dependent 3-hydroxy acid dehydrogenase YdfG